ncbi:hypothetical protein JZ751_000775 [Albula glossodonta]|uniref:Uncharacterized protein n=1 Tax=Albula glossodonta TaxID=121402 RepID=A0A8T2PXB3_9TELE|nr:hypothetical protein JZ751_000775 [Albula glossodonta]
MLNRAEPEGGGISKLISALELIDIHALQATGGDSMLVIWKCVDETDAALVHGVVLVAERCQDAGHVAQGWDLVSHLGLSAEETHRRRGNRLQGLTLDDIHKDSNNDTRNSRGLRSTQPGWAMNIRRKTPPTASSSCPASYATEHRGKNKRLSYSNIMSRTVVETVSRELSFQMSSGFSCVPSKICTAASALSLIASMNTPGRKRISVRRT